MGSEPQHGGYAFWGHYGTKVLEDGRIRLRAGVTRQFENAGVSVIWPSVVPNVKALALVPDAVWPAWLEYLQAEMPFTATPEGYRLLVSPSKPIQWASCNRIYISTKLMGYAELEPLDKVCLLGVKDHFEVWKQDRFDEMARKCHMDL